MASESDRALPLAELALTRRLSESVDLDEAGYCRRAEDNLVQSVGPGPWQRAQADLEKGKGDELAGKFRAPYSSSALAVNTFSPLLDGLSLPGGLEVKGRVAFEQQRSAWASGYWPTLDLTVEDDTAPIRLFVESKCIEFLRKGSATFSDQFVTHAAKRLDGAAARTFKELAASPAVLSPLDARQLAQALPRRQASRN